MDGQLAHISNPRGAINDRFCRGNPADWDDQETKETPKLDEEGEEEDENEVEDEDQEESSILDQEIPFGEG